MSRRGFRDPPRNGARRAPLPGARVGGIGVAPTTGATPLEAAAFLDAHLHQIAIWDAFMVRFAGEIQAVADHFALSLKSLSPPPDRLACAVAGMVCARLFLEGVKLPPGAPTLSLDALAAAVAEASISTRPPPPTTPTPEKP